MSTSPPPAARAAFVVTTSTSEVRLDAGRKGQAVFTVTNGIEQNLRARADVTAEANADRSWFTVVDPERDAPIGSTQQFTVQIAVPATTAPGSYRFRLDVTDPRNPDELSGEGPWTAAVVSAPPPPRREIPWLWILIAAGAVVVLAVIGLVVFLLTRPAAPGPVNVSATVQSFGTVQVNQSSPGSMVTVENAGKVQVRIDDSLSGANQGDFTVVEDTCRSATLPAGQRCQVQIAFTPKSQGAKQVTFQVTAQGAQTPAPLKLTGTGLGVASVTFDPQVLSITLATRIGAPPPTAGTGTVTVKNVGSADLRIASVSLDTGGSPFTFVSSSCTGAVLTPNGNTCTVTVQFSTLSVNQRFDARILVFDDQPGSPHAVPVTGIRSQIFCRPAECFSTNPLFSPR
jgi:hypothetical protein